MEIQDDDVSVFKILEIVGKSNLDLTAPSVSQFTYKGNWCLLLFKPYGNRKGCRLYSIKEAFLLQEIEKVLIPDLLSIPEDVEYDFLKNEALVISETIIRTKKSTTIFGDAH